MSGMRFSPTPFGKVMWAYACLITAIGLIAVIAIQHG